MWVGRQIGKVRDQAIEPLDVLDNAIRKLKSVRALLWVDEFGIGWKFLRIFSCRNAKALVR
jgi:hypothetical protein